MFELFGIGRTWAGAFKADPFEQHRPSVIPDSLISTTLTINESSSPSAANAARDRFRTASGALQDAFGAFVRGTVTGDTATAPGRKMSPAVITGVSARVSTIDVDYYGLQASNEVNSRTTTVRASSGAIGLDLTEATSILTSDANLGLDVVGAASVKTSKAEMNTGFDTSYGSSSLTFANGSGTSTSLGSLTGTYKGTGKAADATSLEITVTKGGTIREGILGLGKTKVEFDVRDQTGEVVFSYSGNVYAGDTISLGGDIGLSIAFGEGNLQAGHKAETTVAKTPITVDANARFDAAVSVRPQFEAVAAVTAGSFKVNDTVIEVFADDTVNAVLDRITNSAAGVTATLAGDKVTFASKANSEENIDVGNDTSGFVKAVRLDGTTTTKGNLRDDERLLKDTTGFRDVRNGSFTINGRSIAINKDQDTLATVIGRINGSGAGVTASLNQTTNRIEIVSNSPSEDPIVVASDTTGFLGMARLSTSNTAIGNIRDDQQALSDVSEFTAVTSGSFTINGVSISVDKDADSLSSIISRINGSGSGVTAAYDAVSDRVTVTPDSAGATLSIDNDTTGLLAALKLASGTAATQANADGAFNAAGAAGPLFDAGYSVRAGSFTVNGVAISVAADDTINAVVAKITSSSAGVIASYDEATDRVTLTATESGAPVTLGTDTSGFLAAVKLDGTAATSQSTVSYSPFNTALSEMTEYAGVTTGTLTVNGQQVAIDPMTTTISSFVDALNDLSGVDASIDHVTGAIRISSRNGRSLTTSDTSGVLSALGIDEGTVVGRARSQASQTMGTSEARTSNAAQVAAKTATAVDQLNSALDGITGDGIRQALESVVDRLRDQGLRGFHVTVDGDRAVLAVETDELAGSLDAIADHANPEKELAAILEALEGAIASAAGWEAPPKAVQTVKLETARTQLMAEQAAGSLLQVRSSLQPQEPAETTRKAVLKAYGTPA